MVELSTLSPLIDTASNMNKGVKGTPTALTDTASIAIALADANNFTLTLGGNRILANPSDIADRIGQTGSIDVSQDGTGSRTLSYGSYYEFAAGTAPTLTTTASATDILVYKVKSATEIHISFIGDSKV